MKTSSLIIITLLACPSMTMAQKDSTGLPGDNFSLEGALELFKKSSTPEEFEKALNTEDNYVNDLDLNQDGKTDYIKVIDKKEGNAHALVLQVDIDAKESQDIAVIEIEKTGEKSAVCQITGDEYLYGESRIAEPKEEVEKDKGGPSPEFFSTVLIVNVWFWPCVPVLYSPSYVVWVSPWYWGYYPGWYRPWGPRPWRWHHAGCAPYRSYHHVVYTHRVTRAHRVYSPHRRTSVKVVNHYHGGHFKPRHDGHPGHVKSGHRPGGHQRHDRVQPNRGGHDRVQPRNSAPDRNRVQPHHQGPDRKVQPRNSAPDRNRVQPKSPGPDRGRIQPNRPAPDKSRVQPNRPASDRYRVQPNRPTPDRYRVQPDPRQQKQSPGGGRPGGARPAVGGHKR